MEWVAFYKRRPILFDEYGKLSLDLIRLLSYLEDMCGYLRGFAPMGSILNKRRNR